MTVYRPKLSDMFRERPDRSAVTHGHGFANEEEEKAQ
jgi:hypothetical protein